MDKTKRSSEDNQAIANHTAGRPVASAKDAINAMYASGTGLGDFLSNTSPDQPEPAARNKSAASLHHSGTKRMESVRPSASALLKKADSRPVAKPQSIEGSVDPLSKSPEIAITKAATTKLSDAERRPVVQPVVRTSLKLGPKRPVIAAAAKSSAEPLTKPNTTPDLKAYHSSTDSAKKSNIKVSDPAPKDAVATIKDAASAIIATKKPLPPSSVHSAAHPAAPRQASAPAVIQPARHPAAQPSSASQPARRPTATAIIAKTTPKQELKEPTQPGKIIAKARSRVIQDVVRPDRPNTPRVITRPSAPVALHANVNSKLSTTSAKAAVPTEPKPTKNPLVSISRRASASTQQTASAPRRAFAPIQPSASAVSKSSASIQSSASAVRKSSASAPAGARPLDSVKNRFRPAPKGFSSNSAADAERGRPYRAEDFLNPSHPARSQFSSNSDDEAGVHIYGMMDGPETSSASPNWANPASRSDDGLGIVEDYRRTDGPAVHIPAHPAVDPIATTHTDASAESAATKAPDNNRYVLGAKSPFFLNSVNVEKRPLSPSKKAPELENPIYAGQKLDGSSKSGNVYEKSKSQKTAKSSKSQKSPKAKTRSAKDSAPVVIIPARRKSNGSLFILLVITVILGAALGALVYLCFFQ